MIFVVGPLVVSIVEPVFHVDERQSVQYHLKLMNIEDAEDRCRHNPIETFSDGIDVVRYAVRTVVVQAILGGKYTIAARTCLYFPQSPR